MSSLEWDFFEETYAGGCQGTGSHAWIGWAGQVCLDSVAGMLG